VGVPRWLLPIVAAITLASSSAVSYAAAGMTGEAACCCPVKAKCKCHDHDGTADPTPTVKRCGGENQLVAPIVMRAVVATVVELRRQSRAADLTYWPAERVPDRPVYEIETPPF
jgi:hypothetical protein